MDCLPEGHPAIPPVGQLRSTLAASTWRPLSITQDSSTALELGAGTTEATFPRTIPFEGFVEVVSGKIGPVAFREVQLGVGELPDQKIGNALLAPCANEQVGLGRKGHGKIGCECGFVDGLRVGSKFRPLGQ